MNIKYTSDGKKVSVLGKLNAQESIVQEIFVTQDGAEIPSGENFVVKSLHDAPAVSWKEKNLADLEKRYENRKAQIERETEHLNRQYNAAQKEASAFIKEKLHWRKNIKVEALDTLYKFLNDEITHVVKTGWDYAILPFKPLLAGDHNYREDLRLISLFGSSEGNLDWRLNYYRDGSGTYEAIVPCTSLEEANEVLIKTIQEKIPKNGVDERMIKAEKQYCITALTDEHRNEYYRKILDAKKQNVEKLKSDLLKNESEIGEFTERHFPTQGLGKE